MFFLGLASALVASALFNVGIALQGLEARAVPRSYSLRPSLLVRLLRRPRWLLGFALGIIGIGPQVLALALAPFVVVQTALAAGLLLLLALGVRMFGEHVGWFEVSGVGAIIGGVALVSFGAPPHVEAHRGGLALAAVVGALSACALAPFLAKGTRWDTGMLAVIASGCGFGAANIATKLVSDDVGSAHWPPALLWAVIGLGVGAVATLTGMTAFQRAPATVVVPVSTAVQIFVPVLLEPLFLREHWEDANSAAAVAAGVGLALVGSVVVSRTRGVSELAARSQR